MAGAGADERGAGDGAAKAASTARPESAKPGPAKPAPAPAGLTKPATSSKIQGAKAAAGGGDKGAKKADPGRKSDAAKRFELPKNLDPSSLVVRPAPVEKLLEKLQARGTMSACEILLLDEEISMPQTTIARVMRVLVAAGVVTETPLLGDGVRGDRLFHILEGRPLPEPIPIKRVRETLREDAAAAEACKKRLRQLRASAS